MNETIFDFTTYEGKGKNKVAVIKKYRLLTADEMKQLSVGSRIPFIARGDVIKEIKVTSVKTWKTRRDVHVGLKYGLYEYGYSEMIDLEGHFEHRGEFLVVEVENAG